MDVAGAIARFEATLAEQASLAGDDPALGAIRRTMLAALRPAMRELAMDLAEQAAAEVAAQLPEYDVDVVLREGDPLLSLRERAPSDAGSQEREDYEARITLRLPPSLKGLIEDAAGTAGESVNSWVVDAVSGAARRSRHKIGQRVQGRVRT
jgi:hypothetical protein